MDENIAYKNNIKFRQRTVYVIIGMVTIRQFVRQFEDIPV